VLLFVANSLGVRKRKLANFSGAPSRWNRETWQRVTRLNRSQRVEHPSAQEKIEHAER